MLNLDPEPACYVLRYTPHDDDDVSDYIFNNYIHLSYWCPTLGEFPERFELVPLAFASRFTQEAARVRAAIGSLAADSRLLDFLHDGYTLDDVDPECITIEYVPAFDTRQSRLL